MKNFLFCSLVQTPHYNDYSKNLLQVDYFQNDLRENHSDYWSAEDSKTIDKVGDVLSKLNAFKVGASVALNRDGNLYFNERNWDITRQLSNTSRKRR